MVRIADGPAAHAGAQINKADRNGSDKRLPFLAVLLQREVVASCILARLDDSTAGRRPVDRVLCFSHLNATPLFVAHTEATTTPPHFTLNERRRFRTKTARQAKLIERLQVFEMRISNR